MPHGRRQRWAGLALWLFTQPPSGDQAKDELEIHAILCGFHQQEGRARFHQASYVRHCAIHALGCMQYLTGYDDIITLQLEPLRSGILLDIELVKAHIQEAIIGRELRPRRFEESR